MIDLREALLQGRALCVDIMRPKITSAVVGVAVSKGRTAWIHPAWIDPLYFGFPAHILEGEPVADGEFRWKLPGGVFRELTVDDRATNDWLQFKRIVGADYAAKIVEGNAKCEDFLVEMT